MAGIKDLIGLADQVRTEKLDALGLDEGLKRSLLDNIGTAAKLQNLEALGMSDEIRRSLLDATGSVAKLQNFETLGISDEVRRSLLDATGSVAKLQNFETLGISDEVRRSLLDATGSVAKLQNLETLGVSDEIRRSLLDATSSVSQLNLETLGMSDEIRRSLLDATGSVAKLQNFETLGISDELKRSFERTSVLAQDVDDAISRIRIPDRDYGMVDAFLETPNVKFSEIELAPNPILETNSQLAELTRVVTQLVDVAKQQAELTQAIRNASDLALSHAIQSGNEAKAATQLARTSVRLTLLAVIVAIISTFASIGLTIYGNHRQSISADGLRQEDLRNRQEEIRVLRDISSQLKSNQSTKTIKPQPMPKSTKPGSSANR